MVSIESAAIALGYLVLLIILYLSKKDAGKLQLILLVGVVRFGIQIFLFDSPSDFLINLVLIFTDLMFLSIFGLLYHHLTEYAEVSDSKKVGAVVIYIPILVMGVLILMVDGFNTDQNASLIRTFLFVFGALSFYFSLIESTYLNEGLIRTLAWVTCGSFSLLALLELLFVLGISGGLLDTIFFALGFVEVLGIFGVIYLHIQQL
ncbi:MAG: hypothetical protein ACXAE3_09305 [Candidatus Kariarchaeaceae archaeon]|jgi:hypothetical protein